MRRILALLAVSLVSSAVACGGSDSTSPTADLTGTWNLSTINGSALPFAVQASDPKIEVLNDQIIASSTGTFTETGNARFTSTTGVVTNQAFADSGTWTVSGTAVSFNFNSDGSTGTATLSGNTFIVAGGGLSQVYVKQ
jgi:hypothetical protein